MNLTFPPKEPAGIAKLLPHVSEHCTDLISKLLAYSPDERLSARQALRHPYFRDLREAEKRAYQASQPQANITHSPSTSILSRPFPVIFHMC